VASELAERCKDRWPDILRQLGLLSSAALAGKDVPCPMCGGIDRFRFSDKGFGRWFCRGCGYGGDGVNLVMSIKRVGFEEAATIIEGVVGATRRDTRAGGNGKPRDPLKSWRNAAPFTRGSAADLYLRGRKLTLTEVEARSLRHHCELWHWPSQTRWPAMVACVSLADGAALTTHQTFIKPDGSGKAPIDRARLFASCETIAGGGVWFGEADPEREFAVGEGIESTLSTMRIFGVQAGCAALSEGGMRRLVLPPGARAGCAFSPTTMSWARVSPLLARLGDAGAPKGARSQSRSPIGLVRTPMTSGAGERREQRSCTCCTTVPRGWPLL
jgi:putative DNA primase/helicase